MPYYRYAVHGYWDGIDTTRNVFYLGTGAAITNHSTVIGELLNQFYQPLLPYMSDLYTLAGADVSELEALEWGVNIFYPSVTKTGGDAGEALPHQCAAVITGYTFLKGCRGRKFVGGFSEDSQANGILVPTAYTALQQAAAVWLNGIQPPGQPAVQFVVIPEKTKAPQGLRAAAARDIMGTMRSRKPGRGLG